MRAGRLDRRIRIERKTVSRSAYGDQIEAWSAVATVWASVAPVRGEERYSPPQLAAREQVEFRIRWQSSLADLSPLDRIVYPLPAGSPAEISERDTYDILAVHEIGRREGLRIIAARRVDGA